MFKKFLIISFLITGALLLSGCSGGKNENEPEGKTYANRNIGLSVVFPPEVENFEKIETQLGSSGINAAYRIEFGKDKGDFSGEAKNKGNLLSVYIFEKNYCNIPRFNSFEKDFCDTHRDDTKEGLWNGYYSKNSEKQGYWMANNRLLYYFDVDGADEVRNAGKRVFIERLKIELN